MIYYPFHALLEFMCQSFLKTVALVIMKDIFLFGLCSCSRSEQHWLRNTSREMFLPITFSDKLCIEYYILKF